MTASEMETACRKMADAFLDYDWSRGNRGMCEYLDREHFYRLTRGYFEAAVRNGSLYSAGDRGEGYMIFETPETKSSLGGSLLLMKWMADAYGPVKGIRQIGEILRSGTFLAADMRKRKQPFTKIEFIAVTKAFQKQGHMRRMIDYAFSVSGRLGLPCILTTDDEKKVRIYEHFGMKMVREHRIAENATYYDMLWEHSASCGQDLTPADAFSMEQS